ncbi:hypothetical protein [Actinotalea sp. K2]|uniref:hypothetical protein n=1 Tax=Actinotalea sp. K2 TaxID=2939438 RepID=UPI002016FFE7|nr:hypothetical protein [Actinotalea sp. K2]MCL3861592.1 hypothetical protein [Actinotalea sp. K2]
MNQHPEFVETFDCIQRSFGAEWAKRFVLTAPLMIDDPEGAMCVAFERGLMAYAEGRRDMEIQAWATCQRLLRELAASLVAEAEALLTEA